MNPNTAAMQQCLKSFDFATLFREHLGWDNCDTKLNITLGDTAYPLAAVAQKHGFRVFLCPHIPQRPIRMKIDRQVTQFAYEHFIIYADKDAGQQVWQWVRQEPGKPKASREQRFEVAQPGTAFIQKLVQIAISFEEEEDITLPEVAWRVRSALDVDKVTKKFYDLFKKEHTAFMQPITGIEHKPDLEWYTSLMLNRVMFVYFIQKKGFLDGDHNYLRNRLNRVRESRGKDKFQSFYRYFLLRLFHQGLGQPEQARQLDPEMEQLLGSVPFLNGGFFEVHKLEECNPEIDIPDETFDRIFEFFDHYQWHLDDRPLRNDNEINPDVVGYIFEKYINQKQMGAYYTKEDITEYISKNTILPYLFDAARNKCAVAFKPDSAMWQLLRDDPDRYIYPAMRQGVIDENGETIPLPGDIEAGVKDVTQRGGWNRPAEAPYALPTETWREHIARRQRCLAVRNKLSNGEVHTINDLITLNLDIWQFARDAIVGAEGPELLRAFWHTLAGKTLVKSNQAPEPGMTILDPTCGSGAFLFAALRILETLYGDCLERMRQFVEEDDARLKGKQDRQKYEDFRHILQQIGKHPNERYFTLKSIIINNLFGVDIMAEAVEICKLRLFLTLAAQVETVEQIEPLPDIDFNIRAGNTLVGFTSLDQVEKSMNIVNLSELPQIKESAAEVDRLFQHFRLQQTAHGGVVNFEDKQNLRERVGALDGKLDRYLANAYGVEVEEAGEFEKWRSSHDPFHWFAEFYGIMRNGGFDVVIGNPPYVSAAKVRKTYTVKAYTTERCPDIYAWCLERVSQLVRENGNTGMIVPLSLGFSGDFSEMRSLLYSTYKTNWFSSFGRIPAALFSHDVRVRNIIHIGAKSGKGDNYTTRLHRWFDTERSGLLNLMSYSRFDPTLWSGRIPKINTQALMDAFENAAGRRKWLAHSISTSPTRYQLFFKKTAYNWLNFCREMPPCYDKKGKPTPQTKFGTMHFEKAALIHSALCLLNGKIMLTFWFAIGDDFDVTKWMFADLPADLAGLPSSTHTELKRLTKKLETAMNNATTFKLNAGKQVGNYNLARCRSVTDQSDMIFAKAFGFDHVWEDIELMYVQCIRTDFNDGEDK